MKYLIITALTVLSVSALYAGNKCCPATAKKAQGMAPYCKEAVTTVKGTVTGSESSFNRHMNEEGLHLTVKAGDTEYTVHVCPEWYASKKTIVFGNGDKVVITGCEFDKKSEKNIYAAEITLADGSVLKLRDKDTGAHLWKGRNAPDTVTDTTAGK